MYIGSTSLKMYIQYRVSYYSFHRQQDTWEAPLFWAPEKGVPVTASGSDGWRLFHVISLHDNVDSRANNIWIVRPPETGFRLIQGLQGTSSFRFGQLWQNTGDSLGTASMGEPFFGRRETGQQVVPGPFMGTHQAGLGVAFIDVTGVLMFLFFVFPRLVL